MTEELQHLIADLTCRLCNGVGMLFSRVAHPVDGRLVNFITHRPCHICGGLGHRQIGEG